MKTKKPRKIYFSKKKFDFFKLFFKKVLHFFKKYDIILKLSIIRPVGQAAKTLASHAGNMGSIPVRVTKKENTGQKSCVLFFDAVSLIEHSVCLQTHGFAFCELARRELAHGRREQKYSPSAKFPHSLVLCSLF